MTVHRVEIAPYFGYQANVWQSFRSGDFAILLISSRGRYPDVVLPCRQLRCPFEIAPQQEILRDSLCFGLKSRGVDTRDDGRRWHVPQYRWRSQEHSSQESSTISSPSASQGSRLSIPTCFSHWRRFLIRFMAASNRLLSAHLSPFFAIVFVTRTCLANSKMDLYSTCSSSHAFLSLFFDCLFPPRHWARSVHLWLLMASWL